MERLRRLGREVPSAAAERLLLALALSLSLHAFLLYQFASQPKTSSPPGLSIISARLATPAPRIPSAPEPMQRPGPETQPQSAPLMSPLASATSSGEPASGPLPERDLVLIGPQPKEPVLDEPEVNAPDINEPQPADSYVTDPGPLTSAFPDPVHYPAKELDVYPRLLAPLAVSYPERADQLDGRVSLLLLIDEAGRVSGVTVVDSEPEGVFDDAAVRAYSLAAFSPARKDGRTVRSRILVAVEIKAAMRVEGE